MSINLNFSDMTFEDIIKLGINEKIITISDDEKKITYHAAKDFTDKYTDPEEKVRAVYFVELVLKYKYPTKKIDFEVTVPRRTPSDLADIVIYEDEELKIPYLVVECKKDGVSDAEYRQAIEQAFGNANSLRSKYASVVAGTTRTIFDVAGFKPMEREKNTIADIPVRYSKAPKYQFIKGVPVQELKAINREELIKTLEKTHDTVWQGGKLAPTTAFDEVSKLLFCKLQDEKERLITKKGEPYKFQIGTHESAEEVFDRVNKIYEFARQKDAEVFKEGIRLEPKIVYNVVEHLQSINFSKTDLDTKGVAFERFMEDFFKGKMGQFFTPREIIQFAVKMMDINEKQRILDPACGSGGFLLNTLDHIRQLADQEYSGKDEEKENYAMWHGFAENNLYGIEINDQIARVCKMNMIIHDDGHTNVINTDSLQDFDKILTLHPGFQRNSFEGILTNPPFGATVKKSDHKYFDDYDLGNGKKTQKTEILFIERCYEFLKPKTGKMAIVLPDGILTNSSLQYVRDYIMDKFQILAVVSLPQFAFSHFGAGVKSSLLFLRKKGKDENLDKYPIFMAIADRIGYDATGRKDPINDFDRILNEYHKFKSNPKGYKGY